MRFRAAIIDNRERASAFGTRVKVPGRLLETMPGVGLNSVGFDLPLLAAALITVALAGFRHARLSRGGAVAYASAFVVPAVGSVLLFVMAPDPGSLAIPEGWGLALMIGSGTLYAALFVGRRLISVGILEAYAIGTYAMVANDVLRTYFVPLPVAVRMLYWGGNGVFDLVFQFGLYSAATFLVISGAVAVLRRKLVEEVIGPERAARFWTRTPEK